MPAVTAPAHQKGDFCRFRRKSLRRRQSRTGPESPGQIPHRRLRGLDSFVNLLQATRLQRKGFETSILLYGPGVTLGLQRGFPRLGDESFPGHQNYANQIAKFIEEGGKVYACRFALQALYGHGEPSLLPGIRPINPLDVLDIVLLHQRDNAFILDTWTL
ncbi:MSMEG_0572/Sll0783 family nitrogen starvation response protein [Methylomonas koyamae]|uniref:MSMEG_0572/Sll0783 family nitrogen starvation response protein n=1 Tax=Methylomonas koyamae TaxID=702114 RepID=UPI0009E773FE|nr:MSMEG_0572/Sll0783 family nitrogen starvation response protein [Methylomonas koyamae]